MGAVDLDGANTAEAKVAEPKPSAATGPQPEVNADNAKAKVVGCRAGRRRRQNPQAEAKSASAQRQGQRREGGERQSQELQSRRRPAGGAEARSGQAGRIRRQPEFYVNADDAAQKSEGRARPDAAKAAELKPDVKILPEAETNAAFAELDATALGDVLLVGLANDPQSVERIVAEAV